MASLRPHGVGFAVSDLAAAMAELRANGVSFERIAHLPQDESGVLLTSEGARVAWMRDPDGNYLSIVQYCAVPVKQESAMS